MYALLLQQFQQDRDTILGPWASHLAQDQGAQPVKLTTKSVQAVPQPTTKTDQTASSSRPYPLAKDTILGPWASHLAQDQGAQPAKLTTKSVQAVPQPTTKTDQTASSSRPYPLAKDTTLGPWASHLAQDQ